jgi:cytochrome P450
MLLKRPDEAPVAEDFDPISPQSQRDPHDAYRELRGSCPIAHSNRWGGFWALSRYEDIVDVTKQHEMFINSVQNVVPAVTTTGRRPPLHFDPPEHTLWRKAMSAPFKNQSISDLEPKVRAFTVELLTPLLERRRGDLVSEVAVTLPVLVLCVFLNAPEDAPAQIRELSNRFLRAFQARDAAALEDESRRLYALARRILEARRHDPLDPERDVASALLAMRIEGKPVSEELLEGALRQLLIAGHVAVTMMMGSCARHLAAHRHLQQELRSRPSIIPAAIEELLRLYTPNQGFCRTAVRDVELLGKVVHPREPIVLLYPSANRDEAKFEAPDDFVIDRPAKHLAFGNGVHKCPGELLARLELRVFLEELLARTAHFELDGPVELAPWPEYGPKSLPLRLELADAET